VIGWTVGGTWRLHRGSIPLPKASSPLPQANVKPFSYSLGSIYVPSRFEARHEANTMKISRLAIIAYALAACGSSSLQAQEFQVFDHGLGQSEMPRASLEDNWSSRTFDGAPAPQPSPRRSFKEALYEPLIRQAEVRYQLPPRLLQALVWQESRFDPMAISSAGAAGLAQLMPATARELGVGNRHDPGQSIDGGARYLRQMLDRFGAIHLALAAYNAGPGAVSRAGGIPKNRETPGYVRSVLARWVAYSAT
jgi:soluble lytic murein transglycosylase-like protein